MGQSTRSHTLYHPTGSRLSRNKRQHFRLYEFYTTRHFHVKCICQMAKTRRLFTGYKRHITLSDLYMLVVKWSGNYLLVSGFSAQKCAEPRWELHPTSVGFSPNPGGVPHDFWLTACLLDEKPGK